MVEVIGIEPTTSCVQGRRSPNWATPPRTVSPDRISKKKVVGLDRFELSTSRLSGVRSNQLSYRPISKGLQRTPILKCPIFYRIGVKDIAGIDLDSSVSLKVISAP